jgi:hypothetical protein
LLGDTEVGGTETEVALPELDGAVLEGGTLAVDDGADTLGATV